MDRKYAKNRIAELRKAKGLTLAALASEMPCKPAIATIAKLEKGLGLLATISGGAPMIGFLGTVIGMVQAFFWAPE